MFRGYLFSPLYAILDTTIFIGREELSYGNLPRLTGHVQHVRIAWVLKGETVMKEKTWKIRKGLLRLLLVVMIGLFAGAAPGTALVSHAETVAVTEAALPAEATSENGGLTFLLIFFGGIMLLILFVVVVVVASSISAVGVFDVQED